MRVPNSLNEKSYKDYTNKLQHSLRIAKPLYYEKKLEDRFNKKATWRILTEVINKNRSKSKINSIFKIDTLEVSDPTEIANRFCNLFTNIAH